MNYEEFKEKMLEELRNVYGDNAEVDIERLQKNNGICYDGVQIRMKGKGTKVTPVIRLDEIYEKYCTGTVDMEECVRLALRTLKENKVPKSIERFAKKINDWNFIRKNVYPILLSTKDNRELLEKLVFKQMLDLSVVYIIRTKMRDGCDGSIKISKKLMEVYGISAEQLHEQAMENLKEDGYEFQDMDSVIRSLLTTEQMDGSPVDGTRDGVMHVLTNSSRTYGAAGILDGELVKEFTGGRDYYILPSSIHECIFVPVTDDTISKKDLDHMVAEVNATQVCVEERLTDHSYYYNGRTGEIRMCA